MSSRGFIAWPNQEPSVHDVGGKAATLAVLLAAQLPVPGWFALTPRAFEAALTPSQRHAVDEGAPDLDAVLLDVRASSDVRFELAQALASLLPEGGRFAVRSSAVEEDGAKHSFAGQLESFLFVPREQVGEAVAHVWRSAFSERILVYRREHGLTGAVARPAVLIQRMVDADVSGVAFSADPVSGSREVAVVAAVPGLGTGLVTGGLDADTFHVDREGRITKREIAVKTAAHRYSPTSGDRVKAVPVPPDEARAQSLRDDQVSAVAELARRVESLLGLPQDIEWAYEGDHLHLLQARPITGIDGKAVAGGAAVIWDCSNIAESYSGVTTPLTFSFARRGYHEVYRQFLKLVGVSSSVIDENDDSLRNMLGLVQGRIYYNILNWYRLLALLPGYSLNRRFMEQMMGISESLPPEALPAPASIEHAGRLSEITRVIRTLIGLTWSHLTLSRNIHRFYARLDEVVGSSRPDLSGRSPEELVVYYRTLERRLIKHWDAPLVNDFFAMIFYGVLRRLVASWCADTDGTLQNGLLAAGGGMVSAEPAARMRLMAELAASNPQLAEALRSAPLDTTLISVAQATEFEREYRAYLEKFGDRCLGELKLESHTLHDEPLMLLRMVGVLAAQLTESPESTNTQARGSETRAAAEARAADALRGRPLRRLVFQWVLAKARQRVRDRENLRFERTRVFARARQIFVELGGRLCSLGVIVDPSDVFYLEAEEVLGFVSKSGTTTDLAGLVRLRRAEFDRYRSLAAPPDRFKTRGLAQPPVDLAEPKGVVDLDDDSRHGTGCSSGTVRGPVRVIKDPRNASLKDGEILVAERTDPGWIMLIVSARGLITEHGSLLSHSAIISRELGLPAVVGLPRATSWLKDGDWVELEGASGRVTRVPAPADIGISR
jgi:rifampicin phosphotransferase